MQVQMTNVVPSSDKEAKVAILLADHLKDSESGDYARINVFVPRRPRQTLFDLQVAALNKLHDAVEAEIRRLADEDGPIAG
jgi:hypothetical protein